MIQPVEIVLYNMTALNGDSCKGGISSLKKKFPDDFNEHSN